jgi:hypothetical protein
LPEQKQMWVLNVGKMESTSNIYLINASWWISIKYACRPKVHGNYQIFKKMVHLSSCEKKVILNYTKTWLKKVWAPFNSKNILLQNRSIENTKPRTQIWSHQISTP